MFNLPDIGSALGKLEAFAGPLSQILPTNGLARAATTAEYMRHAKAGHLEAAEREIRRLVVIDPLLGAAWLNLAMLLAQTHRYNEAIECAERAQMAAARRHEPLAEVIAMTMKGHLFMTIGNFERGWRCMEAPRHACKYRATDGAEAARFSSVITDSTQFQDKRVLVVYEGGIGDVIQFSRYIPDLKPRFRARSVYFFVPKALHPLFRTLAVDAMSGTKAEIPPFDSWAPIMSLPWLFQTRLDSIPNRIPYLSMPNADVLARAHQTVECRADGARKKIGIVWAGRPAPPDLEVEAIPHARRSMHIRHFRPLQDLGVQLFSLQRQDGLLDHEGSWFQKFGMPQTEGIRVSDLESGSCSIEWTTAAILNLDLIITIDTSIAHLAGAMGKRVWVLLPYTAEWRWLTERTDSPWYPGVMRLYRQSKPGDWGEVMGRVAADLRAELA